MIGTLEVKCCAAQPQKPLTPCFSFLDSPQSFRIIEVPKAIGTWEITGVQVSVQYPDNTNLLKDATRVSGNVYVATFEGSSVAGKVTQGYKILANGIDEQGNEIEGYVLGIGDIFVMECDQDVQSLVEKHSLRLCEDIPSEPSEGDALISGEELKIYDGTKWITISGGNDDVYTKEEIDEKVAEIDSSISALGDEIPTKVSDLENDSGYLTDESETITGIESSLMELGGDVDALETQTAGLSSDLSELDSSVSALEDTVSQIESSLSELDSTVSGLDNLAVKYATDEKINVVLNSQGHPMTLQINDATNVGDARVIFGSTNRNHISKNSLTIGVPENGETAQHMGDTHVQIGGTQNDAYVLIGQGVTLFSSKEKGKTKMFMDDDRIFVTTPATVEEGQTLKAIKVANETAMSGRSAKKAGEMQMRDEPSLSDEPQNWHWEYVSADLPSKTSDLTNDSGFVNSSEVATFRTWND